ncbi:MAG: folylpolyglutamate synthase/dihydrofolate synthase family protein [Balneolaceae bacterium]|nr:folylpolyglutamate synthase/dihydrofolate synthase family protein [Balneolaceae bacterium]
MKLNTSEELYRYLDRIPSFREMGAQAAHFDLDRFLRFCDAMGNPENYFPAIHVAGTNGKGSTCRILATVYHLAGYKTALYSSPHLLEYRERFQIDGRCITDRELLDFVNTYSGLIAEHRLSYFEISTAIAFWWFGREQVDLAIIETGLGGRLDATNVITPLVSVITNISLDHTDLLGNTIQAIAGEKAGIIKHNLPVVTGNMPEEALQVIAAAASEKNSDHFDAEDLSPRWEEGQCVLMIDGGKQYFETDLINPVQVHNIAVAKQVTMVLSDKMPLPAGTFRNALRKTGSIFLLPGRFEKLGNELEWYFDGAHNPEAVSGMIRAVESRGNPDEAVLVLSLMKDKITPELMRSFQKFKKIYYYTIESARAATIGDINKWLPEAAPFPEDDKLQKPLLKELETELVIFAGSFYFYATVRKWLQVLHSDH